MLAVRAGNVAEGAPTMVVDGVIRHSIRPGVREYRSNKGEHSSNGGKELHGVEDAGDWEEPARVGDHKLLRLLKSQSRDESWSLPASSGRKVTFFYGGTTYQSRRGNIPSSSANLLKLHYLNVADVEGRMCFTRSG